MKGTISLTSSGVSRLMSSMPQDLPEVMRRVSSCMRSGVRATSMPPDSKNVSSSLYCARLSSVSCAISLLWSTRKMKFDA